MIRLAIVGCGKVVEVFHLPALAQVDGLTLAALVDVDPARARGVADRVGASDAHVATDVRDIAGACDAALIALPNHLHAAMCVALIEQGCHVLVEKPMAATVAECDRMIAAAAEAHVVLGVAMVRRFIPAYQLVQTLVANQTYGAVRRIVAREGVAYNWPATTGFFLKQAEAGGGVLVDFGSHVLDAIVWWIGDLRVAAYEDDEYGGVEAECRIDLVSVGGVSVEVELSRLRGLPCTARIEFERATLEINLRSGAADLSTGTAQTIRGQVGVGEDRAWGPGIDPFTLQLRGFAANIAARAGVTDTARTGRNVAALFESCRQMKQPLRSPASPAAAGMV